MIISKHSPVFHLSFDVAPLVSILEPAAMRSLRAALRQGWIGKEVLTQFADEFAAAPTSQQQLNLCEEVIFEVNWLERKAEYQRLLQVGALEEAEALKAESMDMLTAWFAA